MSVLTRVCSECGGEFLWYRVKDGLCSECQKEVGARSKVTSFDVKDALQPVTCPLCGALAFEGQSRCNYCGTIFSQTRQSQQQSVAANDARGRQGEGGLGALLVCLPVAATLVIWFWVSRMSLLQNPENMLFWVTGALILSTSILGTVELMTAPEARISRPGEKPAQYSFFWLIALLLTWFVSFPLYLGARRRYGLSNLRNAGIIVTVLFTLSLAIVANSIQRGKAEVRRQVMQMEARRTVELPLRHE